ncbi:nitrite reductase large subunit NirB [Halobacillus ihumii]|uniref:nitrite reductase large subunit NirB n=1 Tax=Halobacillus ihumii TaxID=2686092 RepID=UPI0013D82F2C|nr:nitrite reductase large subunit NirB [Halobacillus ihumii]
MRKQKLVLIGNGMAGVRCLENIIKEDPEAYRITVFGSEPRVSYSRIMLSSILQGETSFEDIVIHDHSWYEGNNVRLYSGETVTEINQNEKTVITDKYREVAYDKLIIATGSSPFMLPLRGIDKKGVISFRTIEDCRSMMKTAKKYKKAVVIGGGLLGLEAARGLLNLGMTVSVVHISSYLMERQLDSEASRMLQEELESQGMNFLLNKESKEIVGEGRVEGIHFKDGSKIGADLVVMAVGVRPNIQLAQKSGIETNKGILVDDFLKTRSRDIYAIGECVEHNGLVYGLVKPLYEQGAVLAKHLCEKDTPGYPGSVLSTQLKISGIDVFSAGQLTSPHGTKSIRYQNDVKRVYKKIYFQENRAIGAVLVGDGRAGPKILDTILKQKVVSDQDKSSLLESPDPSKSLVASLPPSEQVCTCNSVTKEAIISAVQQNGLSTVSQVRDCTKASSSCGGCKTAVAELLAYIDSNHFNEVAEDRTFCDCTTLTEEEAVRQIQMKSLVNLQEVMKELEWENKEGCPTCRPALEYYLSMIYPEYEKQNVGLTLRKQMTTSPQNNQTLAVVPQLYGGMLDFKQLRKITDVAEKYHLEQIAVAGNQRIHLMGMAREDLPKIVRDLNMPLHSQSGNNVETIQTNIGYHVCRCDKSPSLKIAKELEEKLEFLRIPSRIKVAISACEHDASESKTKDIVAMKVNGGWEIYVGGMRGNHVRAGELLCVVETEKQTCEMIAGFIQYFRESAHYLEQIWQWVARAGLIHIREVLFDKEVLAHLLQSLDTDISRRKGSLVNM